MRLDSIFVKRFYVSFIVFTFAEVFAGSSPFGIFHPWSLLVTFPLYYVHFFAFTTMAIRTKRTSLGHLYLWGCLFGLYETWITKVVWHGYSDDGFAFGSVFGFGLHETLALVFVWHPFMSFILPLSVSSYLVAPHCDDVDNVFPGIHMLLRKEGKVRRIQVAFLVVILLTVGVNYPSLLFILFVWSTTALILFGLFSRAQVVPVSEQRESSAALSALYTLGYRGAKMVALFLGFLYVVGFFILNFDDVPDAPVIAVTVLLYVILLVGLVLKKGLPLDLPTTTQDYEDLNLEMEKDEREYYSPKQLLLCFLLLGVAAIPLSLLRGVTVVLFTVMALLMVITGGVLIVYFLIPKHTGPLVSELPPQFH